MKACDRHARSEGSLKGAPYRLVLVNDEEIDPETMRPKVMLEQELCGACFEDVVRWYREHEPPSAFLMVAPDEPEVVDR